MAGFSRLRRSGRPRLNPLPALVHGVGASVTGHVHPAGAHVRVLMTQLVTAGPPSPTNAAWSSPIQSDAIGNWSQTLTPALAGPLRVWVAMVRNPTNTYGSPTVTVT
jgi:hypothetical protein